MLSNGSIYLIGLVVTGLIVALATLRRFRANPLEYFWNVTALAVGWPFTVILGLLVLASNALDTQREGDKS